MSKKFIFLVFLLSGIFAFATVHAFSESRSFGVDAIHQTISITGIVTDEAGEPLTGATVVEKSTTTGTLTDVNGRFSLSVQGQQSIIRVSYVGYVTQETVVGISTSLTIVLREDANLMDEVVVIGYGTQRRGDVTSAIVTIKSEDFAQGKIGDAAELVKGKVPGLTIVKTSGDPNATSAIRLRGVNSLTGSVNPMVLIDGIEGSLTQVAPENIESIDVLKDASASAIYGTRGSNGVIIITTKTGRRESHAETTYSGYVSLSNWYKTADFMDTSDIIHGLTNFEYEGHSTDWLKAVTRRAGYTQNHSLSLRGGTKTSTYSGNITYSDEEGIMRKSDRNEFVTQLDFSQYAMKDILRFNVNLLYNRRVNSINENSRDWHPNVYRQALIRNPSTPVYNEDDSYHEEFGRLQYYNPRAIQNELLGDARRDFVRITGNITFEPIPGWQTNLMLSIRERSGTDQSYQTSKFFEEVINQRKGSARKESFNERSDNHELTSRYTFNFDKHRFTALAGYSYLYNVNDGFNATNRDFPSEFYLYNSLGQGSWLRDPDRVVGMHSWKNDNTLIGFFGRISYAYDDRFNLLAAVRREGSSKFGKDNKWGTFPSVSAGWNLHNEQFMEDVVWLNVAKLRVGYGISGNNPTAGNHGGSYNSLVMYDYESRYALSQTGQWTQVMQVTQNPNPHLKWEKTQEWNVGVDWRILNNRLGGTVDLYSKKTVDLLFSYAVPVPPNMYHTMLANVGEMLNEGIEVSINAIPVKTRDFVYNTTLIFSSNRNKLLSLSNDLYETASLQQRGGVSEPISVPTHCIEEGKKLGDFFGLKSGGVSEKGFVWVEVFEEVPGTDDGIWVMKEFDTRYAGTILNRQRLGNGTPKLIAGWNHFLSYKDFDLNMQFTGQFGYKILNVQRMFYENNSIPYNRLKTAANWHGAVDETGAPVIDPETGKQKQVRLAGNMGQGFWSDHLENGNFLKLTNVTLGYTLPIKNKEYVNSARVYLSGSNLFCITKYTGLDPEVSIAAQSPGIDSRDKYPTIRSVTFGVNLSF